jgi:uncharacterized protein YuzB (UPF0349 family)
MDAKSLVVLMYKCIDICTICVNELQRFCEEGDTG